ncbi:MAG: hypothetical protein K8R89_00720, partial [Anaerolineae bacterium]|nr:hypothetical protein [Anaerolineae bacterium]
YYISLGQRITSSPNLVFKHLCSYKRWVLCNPVRESERALFLAQEGIGASLKMAVKQIDTALV